MAVAGRAHGKLFHHCAPASGATQKKTSSGAIGPARIVAQCREEGDVVILL